MKSFVTQRYVPALLALNLFTIAQCAAAAEKPVNVLFLMMDQVHYQALGFAGNPVVKTPNLDRLAASGTRFTQSFCVVPYCSPTRAAIVTGRYPASLGIGRNIAIGPNAGRDALRLHEPVETYMHHLAALGYHCHQLGKWHLGVPAQLKCYPDGKADDEVPAKRFEEGLAAAGKDAYEDDARPGEVERYDSARRHGESFWMRKEIADAYHKYQEQVEARAASPRKDLGAMGRSVLKPQYWHESVLADYCIELMRRHGQQGEAFAITYSISPPHEPFVAPAPFYDLYDPAALPIPETWALHPVEWAKNGAARTGLLYGEAGLREHMRCYYARVSLADEFIGRILKALDEMGLAERTLVVFTSDHGTMLGQHGMMEKSTEAFYDDLMRVPLILRLPGQVPAGKTSDATASSVDLAPTILDYLGAEPLKLAHGRSLRPVVQAATPDDVVVFGERGDPASPGVSRMIRTRQWKLGLHGRGPKELYDLEHDPAETKNLAADPAMASVIEKLTAQLLDHMRAVSDPAVEKYGK